MPNVRGLSGAAECGAAECGVAECGAAGAVGMRAMGDGGGRSSRGSSKGRTGFYSRRRPGQGCAGMVRRRHGEEGAW